MTKESDENNAFIIMGSFVFGDMSVDKWIFNLLKIISICATTIVAKINVSTASATTGATAEFGLRAGIP
jgi:hypothetical protein